MANEEEDQGACPAAPVTALAPPSGVKPASGLEQSRSSTGAGSLTLLRTLVEYDIKHSGRNCSTMIRAGLLLDILDELEVHRREKTGK